MDMKFGFLYSSLVEMINRKLYWTEKRKLRCADPNGENIQDVITELGELTDLGLRIDSAGEMGVAAAPEKIGIFSQKVV